MPKNNMYLPKENLARVEEIREIENKELITPEWQEQIINDYKERWGLINNKSKLSPAARSKIIKRYGADYLSERAFDHDIALMQMYGPGWGEWIAKTAIVVGGGFVLGPIPAMVVGGVTAGVAKAGESLSDHPDDKKIFKFIGDCGGGIATGGAIGAAAEVGGALIGAGGEMAGLSSNAANAAARRAAKEFFVVDGIKVFADAGKARVIAAAGQGIKMGGRVEKVISFLKDAGFAAWEAEEHVDHVKNGYDYKSWCKVCNA
jgi:hypothetical protein